MKIAIAGLGAAIASLLTFPVHSAASEFCPLPDGREIPTNVEYGLDPYENGFVRRDADLYHSAPFDRKVGEIDAGWYAMASAQAFDAECNMWVFVTFPTTQNQAWIRADNMVFMGPVD